MPNKYHKIWGFGKNWLFFERIKRHGRSAGKGFELNPMIALIRAPVIVFVIKDRVGDLLREGRAAWIAIAAAVEVFAVNTNRNHFAHGVGFGFSFVGGSGG